MVYDTGYSSHYKMKLESAWGTAVTPDVDVGLLEATGEIKQTQGVEENFGTGLRTNNQLTYGKYGATWSLTGKILNGKMLAYALGTDTPTGSAPAGYTHTLAIATAVSPFTLGQYFQTTDKGLEATGCKVNDFNLSMDVGGILTGTFNGSAKTVASKASGVGTRPALTQTLLPSYTGSVSWNSVSAEVKSFKFDYSNNLSTDEYSLGDRRIKALPEGQITMGGSFVLVFSSLTEYADFQSTFSTGVEVGTKRALTFVATTGATTTLYELSLGLTNVAMKEVSQAIPLSAERIMAEYSFTPTALGTVTFKDQFATTYIA